MFLEVEDDRSNVILILDVGIVLGGINVLLGIEFGGFLIIFNDVCLIDEFVVMGDLILIYSK